MDPDPAQDALGPVQLVDAGAVGTPPDLSTEEKAQRLGTGMASVLAADGVTEMVAGLADLVSGLVEVDALVLELPRPSTERTPRILVHQGLHGEEVTAYARSTGATVPGGRFQHRVVVHVRGVDAEAARLVLWRTDRPFGDGDRERADLAGTCVGVLVAQYLRQRAVDQGTRWSAAVEDFSNMLAGRLPAAAALRVVVDRIREVARCDLAWLVTRRGDDLVLDVASGAGAEQIEQRQVDRHQVDQRFSLTSEVLATGETLRVDDVAAYGRLLDQPLSQITSRLGPALIQPVRSGEQVVGALGLAWLADQSAYYLSMDPGLPARFAEEVALTLRLGRVRADAERLAVLEERERIRLDLHDRVVQRLYALGTALEAARLSDERSSVDQLLDHAVDRVDESIDEIRRIIAGLSVIDEGMGLYDAMVSIIDTIAHDAPFRPELRVVGLNRVGVEARLADDVLAVLEEALSNVVRHARATRCRVTLEVDGQVALVVEDDGDGMPEGVSASGLTNLKVRAAARGGQVVVTDLLPGTRVSWSVPHSEPADQPVEGGGGTSTVVTT